MQDFSIIVQSIVSVVTVIIAVVALVISIRSEKRNVAQFQKQLEFQEKLNAANLKPILRVIKYTYEHRKGFELSNAGIGTAIITKISFERDGKESRHLHKLLDFEGYIYWESRWTFGEWDYYLRPGESIRILSQSIEYLESKGSDKSDAKKFLESLKNQLDEVSIYIEYSDILGNQQAPLVKKA